MTEIMAKFMWIVARPDNRQYRQNSAELQPENFWFGVEIPLEKDYIFNAEEILVAQLGSGNVDVPQPIYTAKALQFCLDKLGEYLHDPEDIKPEDFTSEDDWSDNTTSKSSEPTESWGEDEKEDKDEKWDESEEKWDE